MPLAMELATPLARDQTCKRCSLSSRGGLQTVNLAPEIYGMGKTLYVVGQSPGDVEDRQGRPMVGGSGSYFRDVLSRSWQGTVVLDNAARCANGATKLTSEMVDSCRPYL